MLPKKKRLTKSDFTNLKPKVIFRGVYVDIATAPGKEIKFSCVVSKKRIKKAVLRNKARRRVYSVLGDVSIKTPCFVVVYPKHTVHSGNYLHLKNEISQVFDTLH